jgi:F0F1-type ATP synthase membrane subunit c/vacuolar-type H+-ATPase subunit K
MNQDINIQPLYNTNIIIWAAFLMSQFIFLAVLFLVRKELFGFDFTKSVLGEEPVVIIIIGLMAVFNFGLSFYMRSQMTQNAITSQSPGGVQSAAIIGLAFCESVGIFGFVLAFMFDYTYFIVFFGLSILGILLHFPKRDNFIAATYKK